VKASRSSSSSDSSKSHDDDDDKSKSSSKPDKDLDASIEDEFTISSAESSQPSSTMAGSSGLSPRSKA
jgi:hypothetical protein